MSLPPAISIALLFFHALNGEISGEIVFQADFNGSSPVTGAVTDNAFPANLNAGTEIGTWTLGGAGQGNPGAIIGNATQAEKSFVFDSAISGNANDLAIGNFTRAIQLSNGEGLVLDFKLYASRQSTGRQVRLFLQGEAGVPAYGIAVALDNSKTAIHSRDFLKLSPRAAAISGFPSRTLCSSARSFDRSYKAAAFP